MPARTKLILLIKFSTLYHPVKDPQPKINKYNGLAPKKLWACPALTSSCSPAHTMQTADTWELVPMAIPIEKAKKHNFFTIFHSFSYNFGVAIIKSAARACQHSLPDGVGRAWMTAWHADKGTGCSPSKSQVAAMVFDYFLNGIHIKKIDVCVCVPVFLFNCLFAILGSRDQVGC